MSETPNIPADWVFLEAVKRTNWGDYCHSMKRLRQEYILSPRGTFRALCDMIAKYEQPPVDPDVEVVKRIYAAHVDFDPSVIAWNPQGLARAVAQYKQERAK